MDKYSPDTEIIERLRAIEIAAKAYLLAETYVGKHGHWVTEDGHVPSNEAFALRAALGLSEGK
jgi:hypothetical protein